MAVAMGEEKATWAQNARTEVKEQPLTFPAFKAVMGALEDELGHKLTSRESAIALTPFNPLLELAGQEGGMNQPLPAGVPATPDALKKRLTELGEEAVAQMRAQLINPMNLGKDGKALADDGRPNAMTKAIDVAMAAAKRHMETAGTAPGIV